MRIGALDPSPFSPLEINSGALFRHATAHTQSSWYSSWIEQLIDFFLTEFLNWFVGKILGGGGVSQAYALSETPGLAQDCTFYCKT
jgi:hypothetical protein